MFVMPSKLWSQTCSMIMVRERTRPAFDIVLSNTAKNLVSIQHGQHEIKNHQIVVVGRSQIEPRLAVSGNIDRKSLLSQSAGHKRGYLGLVFDQQNAHGPPASKYIAV